MVIEQTRTQGNLIEQVEFFRLDANRRLDPKERARLGQFMTPPPVAALMASMFDLPRDEIRILDPGAGVGSLSAAFVAELCGREQKPARISVTACEIDPAMIRYLRSTLELCRWSCREAGVEFLADIHEADFIDWGSEMLGGDLFGNGTARFDACIVNPPYRKINTDSAERARLSSVGVETSNLYSGFVAIACRLMHPGGEFVAITPRSFANGPYFRPFRQQFLRSMSLQRVHVFESRNSSFRSDEVLQENIIVHAVRSDDQSEIVRITSTSTAEDEDVLEQHLPYGELVRSDDPDSFIHLLSDELDRDVATRIRALTATLPDLGLEVSTGRVVDFRAREHLRPHPEAETVPLIYPVHFDHGFVCWPKTSRKPNALRFCTETESLMVPTGVYVLTKRFSAKEEKRRLVAAVFDSSRVPGEWIGFENHLNYFHARGAGISANLAKGLAAFLNSSLADMFFRQFNGHTQVNATDLRSFRYPAREQLERLGERIGDVFPDQGVLDGLIELELFQMATGKINPVKAKRKVEEAMAILGALGFPSAQTNERSALTLLGLLDLTTKMKWSEARNPLRGITPLMDFMKESYGKSYAPNTRETVRRQTMHQFLDAGVVLQNPDDPQRPTNSALNVYQIVPEVLDVVRTYRTTRWESSLQQYLSQTVTLKDRYAQSRQMSFIPLKLPDGVELTLSPGGQNELVKRIIDEFCPRFAPGGRVLVVGDTANKWLHCDRKALEELGITFDEHGKFPDVVVHYRDAGRSINWLLLIEAVTSHGPVTAKRHGELKKLFAGSTAGLVYVTTFLDRQTMARYLGEISWQTEVWVADAPDHLIHFDGERFLGPYDPAATGGVHPSAEEPE